jgi:inorganic pyrophosphatase
MEVDQIIFQSAFSFLGQKVTAKIDRPLGSHHPKWDFIYPLNYGYVPDVPAPDGDELDAYILGVFEPIQEFTGICRAVIHRTNDSDDKLILTRDQVDYSDEQIRALVEFQERFWESKIVRGPRP